jgi:hypothetical protein
MDAPAPVARLAIGCGDVTPAGALFPEFPSTRMPPDPRGNMVANGAFLLIPYKYL